MGKRRSYSLIPNDWVRLEQIINELGYRILDSSAPLSSFVSSTIQIISGHGLTGGGDLSTDRTLDVVESSLSHNLLGGLQGGTTSEYYHLTSAEHASLGGLLSTETDPLSLHLDQTTPQMVINGSPIFNVGLKIIGNTKFNLFQGAGAQAADLTYTLPTAYPGSNNLALIGSTAGVLSWNNQALLTTSSPTFANVYLSSVDPGRVVYSGASGQLSGDSPFTYSPTTKTLTISPGNLVVSGINAELDIDAGTVLNITGGIGGAALSNGVGGRGGNSYLTGGAGGNGGGMMPGVGGPGGRIYLTGGVGGAGGTTYSGGNGGNIYIVGGSHGTDGGYGVGPDGNVYLGVNSSSTVKGSVSIQNLSGILKGTSGVVSAITDNSATWNAAQPGNANLTSLAGMATTVGLVKQTSANTFGIDATVYHRGVLTSGRVPYATGAAVLTDSAGLTYDGTNLIGTGYARFDGGLGVGIAPTTARFLYISKSISVTGVTPCCDIGYTNTSAGAGNGAPTIKGLAFTAIFQPTLAASKTYTSGFTAGLDGIVTVNSNVSETWNMLLPNIYGARTVLTVNKGAGASGALTVTNAYEFSAFGISATNGAVITNAFAFYDAGITVATNNWGIGINTANNYINGSLRLGSAVAPTVALDVTGTILTAGTTGNTYKWNAGWTAATPQTILALPLNVYGAGTIANLLGDPDAWVMVNINGTNYRMPAYL